MEFSSDCNYIPQDTIEKGYFDYLWDVANNRQMGNQQAGGEELSGIAAVTFFQRSGVDKGFLKQIWSLSTPSATMNLQQFYLALRFIALIQNGALPISKEKLLSTLKERLGLPKFVGIDLPVIKPSTTGVPAINPAAFAISPQEHLKYHTLFLQYDTNKDGFLSHEETVPIFKQSGLDNQSVDFIWAAADDDRDGKLTPKEFCAAFHMIVCVTKRQQPVPTSLPISLKGFLVNAPAVPPVDGSIPLAQPPAPVVTPVVTPVVVPVTNTAAVPIPTPSIVQVQPVVSSASPAQLKTVSAAFEDFDSMEPVTATKPIVAAIGQQSAPAVSILPIPNPPSAQFSSISISSNDEQDLYSSIDTMKAANKKTMQIHETALDTSTKTLSSLQGLKQRLATERISLEAFVANANISNQEMSSKLEQLYEEISLLHSDCGRLRHQAETLSDQQNQMLEKKSAAEFEKARLQHDISLLLSQLQNATDENSLLTTQVVELFGQVRNTTQSVTSSQHQLNLVRADIEQQKNDIGQLNAIISSLRQQITKVNEFKSVSFAKTQKLTELLNDERQQANALKQQVESEMHRSLTLHQEKATLLATITSLTEQVAEEKLKNTAAVESSGVHDPFTVSAVVVENVPLLSTSNVVEKDFNFDDGDVSVKNEPFDTFAEDPVSDNDDAFVLANFSYSKFDDHAPTTESTAAFDAFDVKPSDPFTSENIDGFDNPNAFDDAFGSSATSSSDPFGAVTGKTNSNSVAFSDPFGGEISSLAADAFKDPFGVPGNAPQDLTSSVTTSTGTVDKFDDALFSDSFGDRTPKLHATLAEADPFDSVVDSGKASEDPFGSQILTAASGKFDSFDFDGTTTTTITKEEVSDPFGETFSTIPTSHSLPEFISSPTENAQNADDLFQEFGNNDTVQSSDPFTSDFGDSNSFDAFSANTAPISVQNNSVAPTTVDNFDAFGDEPSKVDGFGTNNNFDGFDSNSLLQDVAVTDTFVISDIVSADPFAIPMSADPFSTTSDMQVTIQAEEVSDDPFGGSEIPSENVDPFLSNFGKVIESDPFGAPTSNPSRSDDPFVGDGSLGGEDDPFASFNSEKIKNDPFGTGVVGGSDPFDAFGDDVKESDDPFAGFD